jgi:hypothetical protein
MHVGTQAMISLFGEDCALSIEEDAATQVKE